MKPPLLLYLAHGQDRHRCTVGPALAAAAERAGWAFDVYYDSRRSGRHFGGPVFGSEGPGNGSLVAGRRHLDLALWLTTKYKVAAVGVAPVAAPAPRPTFQMANLSKCWPLLEASLRNLSPRI